MINVHAHHRCDVDFEEHLADWTRDGADITCVACLGRDWQAAGYGMFTNDDLEPWLKKYPDRIIGMAFIETADPVDGADAVQCWYDRGFRGLKIICPDAPYHHEKYWPVYERAQELRMPILFHTGLVAGRRGSALNARSYSEYMRPYYLENIPRRFPDLHLYGAHLGKPHLDEAFLLIGKYENVYYDFSGGGAQPMWQEDIIRAMWPRPGVDWTNPDQHAALRYFGKLMFATDNPPVRKWHAASEYIMDELRIPDDLREDFYWRNAARVFGLTEWLQDEQA